MRTSGSRATSRCCATRSRAGANGYCGMQSANGGWGAFDADNVSEYLNDIPFADHGALLDPPTADVTARCAACSRNSATRRRPALAAALAFLRRSQEARRHVVRPLGHELHLRHVVGALRAQRQASARESPEVRRAVDWLVAAQNADGGWGETADTYDIDYAGDKRGPATASQTAWALLGLMAAGDATTRRSRAASTTCCARRVRRLLARAAIHRHRVSARFLPPLPRVREVLPRCGRSPAIAHSRSRAPQHARACDRRAGRSSSLPRPVSRSKRASPPGAGVRSVAGGVDVPGSRERSSARWRAAPRHHQFRHRGRARPRCCCRNWIVGRGVHTPGGV